jgi:hypothetical protein
VNPLKISHDLGVSIAVRDGDTELFRSVYHPDTVQPVSHPPSPPSPSYRPDCLPAPPARSKIGTCSPERGRRDNGHLDYCIGLRNNLEHAR